MSEELTPGAERTRKAASKKEHQKRPPSRWHAFGQSVPRWFVIYLLPALAAAIVGGGFSSVVFLQGGDSSSPAKATSTGGTAPLCSFSHTQGVLTVEDDYYLGAWTQSNPNDAVPYPKQAHPPNGVRWLPNCTTIQVKCVQNAAPYAFHQTLGGQSVVMTWKLWAHLRDDSWLRLADVAETLGLSDPRSLNLQAC